MKQTHLNHDRNRRRNAGQLGTVVPFDHFMVPQCMMLPTGADTTPRSQAAHPRNTATASGYLSNEFPAHEQTFSCS